MSKGKEFNDILDECLERLLASGETVEQCLERYPEYAADLEPLLQTAMAAHRAMDFRPSEDFRARARYQIRAEMARARVKKWRSILAWQPRWAMVVVAVLAVLLAGSGTVLAADSSMPGALLYPVKLATENVRLTLSSSDVARAELYATLVNRRIAEMDYAIEKGKLQHVERTAERLNDHLAMMSRLSLAPGKAEAAPEGTAKEAPREEKAPEKPGQRTAEKVAPDKPSVSAQRPAVAVEGSGALSVREVSEAAATVRERTKLKALLEEYSVNHPAKLRALLEKAPESARPAIMRTIAASESGYEKALEELDEESGDSPEDSSTAPSRSSDSPGNAGSRPNGSGDSPTNGGSRPNGSSDSSADDSPRPEQTTDSTTDSSTSR